ncbi:MAG: right-handed parallel beta-helix repeat-containing protein [Candidatus Cloacimonetes bacterium]|nr:right-handed parallel beta-helix repeat-containing protein [Candidatus Cloacimonadota bacterium]
MKKILIFVGICALVMSMISCEKTSTDIPSDNSGVLIGSNVYETIQDAIDAAADGDTLRLTQGIYAGTNNTNLMWDGEEKHLTIMTDLRGHQQDYAIIEGNGKGAGFYFGNSFQSNADLIYGITIRNMGSDANYYNAAFYCENAEPTIQYCWVHDCGWCAVYCSHASPRIENSWFYDNMAGFILDGSSNPVLLLNSIEKSELDGVYAIDDSNPSLFNNLIAGNNRGVYLLNAKSLLVSNTIVSNTNWGVRVNSDLLSQMINCIVWANGTDLEVLSEGKLIASYTCSPIEYPDVNPDSLANIYDNPQFISSNDYHLKSVSPCLDIGNTGAVYWTEDLDGEPRIHNDEIDLGAFEWHP